MDKFEQLVDRLVVEAIHCQLTTAAVEGGAIAAKDLIGAREQLSLATKAVLEHGAELQAELDQLRANDPMARVRELERRINAPRDK